LCFSLNVRQYLIVFKIDSKNILLGKYLGKNKITKVSFLIKFVRAPTECMDLWTRMTVFWWILASQKPSKIYLLVHDDSQIVYRAYPIQYRSSQHISKLHRIACSRECSCYLVSHLSKLRNNEFPSHHSDNLFRSDWIFIQSRKPLTGRNSCISSAWTAHGRSRKSPIFCWSEMTLLWDTRCHPNIIGNFNLSFQLGKNWLLVFYCQNVMILSKKKDLNWFEMQKYDLKKNASFKYYFKRIIFRMKIKSKQRK
jgi:hypothetical protein